MGMRILWSLQYQGSAPAIGLRHLEHVLGLPPSGSGSRQLAEQTHFIQFFSNLASDNWESAVVEALDLASRYSRNWTMTMSPGQLRASTVEPKVEEVQVLSFELNAAQYFQTEVEFTSFGP